MTDRTGYSGLQITLHWLVAALILATFLTHESMHDVFRDRLQNGFGGIGSNTAHIWLGTSVFVLVLVRLIVRIAQGAPEAATGGPAILHPLAKWGHWALYGFMILLPLSGAVAWYGGVRPAGEAHEVMFNIFMLVVLGHAAMAILHQYLWRDGTLSRMMHPEK